MQVALSDQPIFLSSPLPPNIPVPGRNEEEEAQKGQNARFPGSLPEHTDINKAMNHTHFGDRSEPWDWWRPGGGAEENSLLSRCLQRIFFF